VLPVQNAETSKAAVAALGLKGQLKFEFDEVLVPVVVMEDVTGPPYGTVVPVNFHLAVAGAAMNNSSISVEPTPGSILVVDRIVMENNTGSAADFEIRLLSAADVDAMTTVSSAIGFNMNSEFDSSGNPARSAALGRALRHTSLLGDVVERVTILQDDFGVTLFPTGWALYGDDPFGPVAMSAANVVVAEVMSATFYGRQFLNKG